jgi:mRNA interferase YafQ
MFKVISEPAFQRDYIKYRRRRPDLIVDFHAALAELIDTGTVSREYNPHELNNPNGNYNGHMEFHLADGAVDVLVIFMPHRTNPTIRLVRMGCHEELFRGNRS